MNTPRKKAVVLMQFGGPESLDTIRPFLYNLFSDRDIIQIPLGFLLQKPLAKYISRTRTEKVRGAYAEIGGKSPIIDETAKQQRALQRELDRRYGPGEVYVSVAMRYWKPFTEEIVRELSERGVTDVILLPLYAQFSFTNAGSSFNEWDRVTKRTGVKFHERRIREYYLEANYIAAFNERIDQGLARFSSPEDVYLLFSAHGTPIDLVTQGDPYSYQIRQTVEAIMNARSDKHRHSLAFQSKVGPKKWLEPETDNVIEELAKEGVRNILVIPVSFVSDHIESFDELGIESREVAEEAGIEQFEVCEGLNDSALFVRALAALASAELDLL